MTSRDFLAEIEKIVEVPSGTLAMDSPLDSLDAWDSMVMLDFIAMADAHLGATVSVALLSKCKTIADLAGLFPGKVES
jgi:acyl carrier protein